MFYKRFPIWVRMGAYLEYIWRSLSAQRAKDEAKSLSVSGQINGCLSVRLHLIMVVIFTAKYFTVRVVPAWENVKTSLRT